MTTRDEARDRLAAALLGQPDLIISGGMCLCTVRRDDLRALLSDHPRPSVSEDQGASRDHSLTDGVALDGWQPIETAPRNGDPFLVADARSGARRVCYRYNPSSRTDEIRTCGMRAKFPATHWMPLPAPPSSAKQAAVKVPGTNPKTTDKRGE